MLEQVLKQLLEFLSTSTGLWTLVGIGAVIAFAAIYHQKRQIPGFTIEAITDDTWFINRDDNHRIAIIVSLRLINKSGSPIPDSAMQTQRLFAKDGTARIGVRWLRQND